MGNFDQLIALLLFGLNMGKIGLGQEHPYSLVYGAMYMWKHYPALCMSAMLFAVVFPPNFYRLWCDYQDRAFLKRRYKRNYIIYRSTDDQAGRDLTWGLPDTEFPNTHKETTRFFPPQ